MTGEEGLMVLTAAACPRCGEVGEEQGVLFECVSCGHLFRLGKKARDEEEPDEEPEEPGEETEPDRDEEIEEEEFEEEDED